MLGVSGLMGSSDAAAEAHESGGASGGSSEVGGSSSIPGGGGGAGNRWPRQETLALLRIRSEMDVAFRDASLKGPLWEEVSRKLAELGFQRNAKKCKEKFENVYKYHKRTKDGRASKSDGKTYRFFDQLEALENTPPNPFSPPPQRRPAPPLENCGNNLPPSSHQVTVSSTTSPTPLSVVYPNSTPQTTTAAAINPPFPPSLQQPPPPQQTTTATINNNTSMNHPSQIHHHHHHQTMSSHPHISTSLLSNSTSSSTSSDEDIQLRRGRKRKWKDYFERLMRDVVHKQEDLQRKFLDALEKRERDRMAREEAWRSQEMARMNREHDLLVQERSIAAAKDAAVITFLQKVADQHNIQIPIKNNIAPPIPPPPPMQVQPPPENHQQQQQTPPQQQPTTVPPPAEQPQPQPQQPPPVLMVTPTKIMETQKTDNGGGDNFLHPSPSRWPKAEVQALINLRTSLDIKYQENGPKGPLWEEISAAMAKLGYNRSSKRCKEKWENINKYYKKVKESNKKRPEDSKTCPYFHQLEAIYKERSKNEAPFNPSPAMAAAPIMARPEQQWPLPQQHQQPQQNQDSIMHDRDQDNESDNLNDHEDDDDDEEDDDDEDEGGNYEIIANKQPSSLTNAAE